MGNQPIIIRRSLFGLVGLILVGLLIAGFIYGLACFLHTQNPRDTTPIAILQLMGVVVLISTAVTAIVYNLHSMTLTDSGVTIKNWGVCSSAARHTAIGMRSKTLTCSAGDRWLSLVVTRNSLFRQPRRCLA